MLMSEKTKAYRDKKTGQIHQLTALQYQLTSNRFEPVEGGEAQPKKSGAEPVEEDEAELLATREEYERVVGQKAGNRKLATMKQEIEEAKK